MSQSESATSGGENAQLPKPKPTSVYRSLTSGAVVFASDTEVYYGLNAVGGEVWELLASDCSTLGELIGRLQERYPEMDPAVIRADVLELLDALVAEGLLEAAGARDG